MSNQHHPSRISHPSGRRARRWAVPVVWAILATLLALVNPAVAGADPSSGFTFTGAGWGHGVGMSQYGARAMGAEGHNHAQILAHYYRNTTIGAAPHDITDLRIHILDASETTLMTSGWMSITQNGVEVLSTVEGQSLRVFAHDGGLQVGDLWLTATDDAPLVVSFPKPITLSANGRSYLWGKLRLTERNGEVRVVETELPMDRYVAGIAEVPADWPSEALAAQAIAARTYAWNVAMHRRSAPDWRVSYDLSASTTDQNYIGWSGQDDPWDQNWVNAADSTSGVYVLHDGYPIRAYYSASSGGHTEHGSLVFAYAGPWVTGVPDPWDDIDNPWSDWTRSYTTAELSAWLGRASDTSVGTVTDLQISGGLGISGRIDRADVTITGTDGTKQVNGRRFMLVVNAGLFAAGHGLDRHLPGTLTEVTPGIAGETPGNDWIRPQPIPADDAAVTPEGESTTTTAPGDNPNSVEPHAVLELVDVTGAVASVSGWAYDPDTPDTPVKVQITVGGNTVWTLTAEMNRPDIAEAHDGAGHNVGFHLDVDLPDPQQKVCVDVLDADGARNHHLACLDIAMNSSGVGIVTESSAPTAPAPEVTPEASAEPEPTPVPAAEPEPTPAPAPQPAPAAPASGESEAPVGQVERLQVGENGEVRLAGWTHDPDSTDIVAVQIRVDGQAVWTNWAADLRPDIAEAIAGAGDRTGFDATFDVDAGDHLVCVVLYNTAEGPDRDLPCDPISVSS